MGRAHRTANPMVLAILGNGLTELARFWACGDPTHSRRVVGLDGWRIRAGEMAVAGDRLRLASFKGNSAVPASLPSFQADRSA